MNPPQEPRAQERTLPLDEPMPSPPGGLEEILGTDVMPEVARHFFGLTVSKEHTLANLTAAEIYHQRMTNHLNGYSWLFSIPAPYSFWKCNMEGVPKATINSTRWLGGHEMWFNSHISRAKDGFERRIEQSQFRFARSEQVDSQFTPAARRPGIIASLFGAGRRR